ncbi:MAG: hypothetical protein AB7P34_12690 [Vicinamibacterales bacterium]
MRRLISAAAIVMVAAFVQIDGISFIPLAAQDRVAGVLAEARKALGGEDKIAGLKALTAEGPFRRSMGGRDMEGMLSLTIVRPDKMRRIEEISIGGMVGGPMIERTSVLAGNLAWDDTANRGGMGGGMRMEIRNGPGPGAGGPGGPAPMTEEQLNEARVRRARVQLHRWMAALVTEGPQAWTDAGIAESPDGKADILETKEETGRVLRLFIDQASHLPLMVQYQDPKPMVMIQGAPGRGPGGPGRGGPGGPPPQVSPEEMQKRVEEMRRNPPALGTYAMHLGDYKKVDGVMLPHKIDVSLDGEPNEEWTVEKYRVNPSIKADTWEKK